MILRLINLSLTASSAFPDALIALKFLSGDLHDVLRLDALEDVTETGHRPLVLPQYKLLALNTE